MTNVVTETFSPQWTSVEFVIRQLPRADEMVRVVIHDVYKTNEPVELGWVSAIMVALGSGAGSPAFLPSSPALACSALDTPAYSH